MDYTKTLKKLDRNFFNRYTPTVAFELLGCLLVRKIGDSYVSGIIVEDEAYRGPDDPASHAYRGLTERNKVMFGEPGHAYVYFTYGFHYCLNVTTEPTGQPGAVLIRALEPFRGIDLMIKNRGVRNPLVLTSGPGRLTKAMMIDSKLNGKDMVRSNTLFITEKVLNNLEVACGERIGIRRGKGIKWRFWIKGNPYVSNVK